MDLSLKKQLLLSIAPSINFLEANKQLLPIPLWFLPNCFPDLTGDVVYNTLFKVEADGLVSKSLLGKTKYVNLSKLGLEKLLNDVKHYRYLREKWDGNMRVLFFDIPEEDRKLRDGLRLSLLDLGFVIWQRSVFITPHNIDSEVFDLTHKLGVGTMVNMMTVNKIIGREMGEAVRQLWAFGSINERYNIFISQSKVLLEEKISGYKKWVARCQKLRFNYYQILTDEPFLPIELCGKEYRREEASRYFLSLGERLINVLERV